MKKLINFLINIPTVVKVLLAGILFFVTLYWTVFIENAIPFLTYLAILVFIPVVLCMRNLIKCLHTLRFGKKTKGMINSYFFVGRANAYTEIVFTTENGEYYSVNFKLLYIFSPRIGKRIIVIYEPDNPDNCIVIRSVIDRITELLISIGMFLPTLWVLSMWLFRDRL